jgi:hypothetical protein
MRLVAKSANRAGFRSYTVDSSHLRQFVVELLPKVGQKKSEPAGEAVLLRDGKCYGRHFQFSEVLAVWYEGQRHVTFYNHYGTPLCISPLSDERIA